LLTASWARLTEQQRSRGLDSDRKRGKALSISSP